MQDPKSRQNSPSGHHRTTLSGYIFATKAYIDNRKKLLSSNMSSTCPHNMVNFSLRAAEIGLPVWGTSPNFNGLRVLAALLHGSKVVSVSQTLRRWTEGATYVRQGDHHVGHWPPFLVCFISTSTDIVNKDNQKEEKRKTRTIPRKFHCLRMRKKLWRQWSDRLNESVRFSVRDAFTFLM